MRKILILFFTFTYNTMIGQTINVENIENGRQVISNESFVLVIGYNYKPGGYGQLSIIQAYDTTLKLKWTFALNDSHTNTIDKIKIADKKIIFTGLVGERDNNNLKTNRYIKALDFDGKIILDNNIGTSTYPCSNLSIDGNVVFFSYQKCETTLFSDMMYKSKNILVKYDLTTKKLEFQEHYLTRSQPEYVELIDKKYFLFGEQYKNEKFNITQTFIKSFPNENNEVLIPSDKMESIGKIVKNENTFTIVSYSNPFKENQERYLRFDKVDINLKLESTRYLPFSKLGWFHIYLEFTSVENQLWFYAFKSDKEASFIRLNENVEAIEEIKSNILDGSNDFYVTNEYIFHLYKEDEKLKLSKLER